MAYFALPALVSGNAIYRHLIAGISFHLEYHRSMRFPPGTQLYVGPPANPPPTALVDAVRDLLQGTSYVSAAYVFNMVVEKQEPRVMIGFVVDADASQQTFSSLMSRVTSSVQPLVQENSCLDFVRLDPSNGVTRAIESTVTPFYRRG